METTIVKIGNSLGSRYSRAYLDKLGLKEGDRVEITVRKIKPNTKRAVAILEAIAKKNGTLANIDLKKWQAERDAEWTAKEEQLRDSFGR